LCLFCPALGSNYYKGEFSVFADRKTEDGKLQSFQIHGMKISKPGEYLIKNSFMQGGARFSDNGI
jgi:hypothetical protein